MDKLPTSDYLKLTSYEFSRHNLTSPEKARVPMKGAGYKGARAARQQCAANYIRRTDAPERSLRTVDTTTTCTQAALIAAIDDVGRSTSPPDGSKRKHAEDHLD
uniref:Uncharacterized protein n=1 Tax=Steinernema glaseri TaxID=37863 RepID=A0A1I7ZJY8_9BILA